MGWIIFFAGIIAWSTCPSGINVKASSGNARIAVGMLAVMWFAWALVVVAMIAGIVIVEVRP